MTLRKARPYLIRAASLSLLLLIWWTVSLFFPPTFVPGPGLVFKRVIGIIWSGEFFFHMYQTLFRVVIGFLLAYWAALILGMVMGTSRTAEQFFDIEVLVGLTIPGMAWAVIAILLFGTKDLAPIFAIFVVVLPLLTVNVWEGTKALDMELVEMAKSFKAGRSMIVGHVVMPQLMPYLFAAARFGFAMSWKVVVVAEIFGLSNGVGYMINYSFGIFSMEDVLAWTIAFTLVMLFLEYGVIQPVESRVTRWRAAVRL